MTREQYLQSVKEIMINKNPYGQYHKQNFDTYGYLDEMTPINSDIINDMPNALIILSEKVYGALQGFKDVTNYLGQEIPFFLYGKEISNNVIEFDDYYTSSDDRQQTEANYNQNMKNDLQSKIDENYNNNFVACHGHSHPDKGDFHQNFSLGDFATYIQMNQENYVFRNRQAELIGCVVTITGDINFVFYDNVSNNFYRFTNVYVKDKNNNLKPINCYGLNQSAQYNGGIHI